MSDFIYGKSPEASWRHLRENGIKFATNVESDDLIDGKPSWFDEERFKRAKESIKTFRVGKSQTPAAERNRVQFSSFTGLLLILQLPEGLEPLLSTGQSKDIASLNKRYLATSIYVESWYDDDIFDPNTKGYKSLRLVRGMHKRVQSNLNDKFKVTDKDGNPRIWYNEYDVAMTQFAFIGLAMLYPKKCGLIAATEEDYEGINYYWRVLGYMMGLRDEFNACQFDKYEDIYKFNKLLFENEYLAKFEKEPCKTGLEMTQGICLALHYYAPTITFNNLAHWWQDCFYFNGYRPQPMTLRQQMIHHWTSLSFNHMFKNRSVLGFSTRFLKGRFLKRLKDKDKVYEKLKKQYKDDTRWTFYSDRVDYFAEKPRANGTALAEECTAYQQRGEQQVIVEGDVCTIGKPGQDDNNNSDQERVYSKSSNGCPFGFGGIVPVVGQEANSAA